MSHPKIDRWINQGKLPQRLLLSGSGDLWSLGLSTAATLTGENLETLTNGLNADVKLCSADEKTLKIGDSQNPEPLSVRGLINWLNQTPVASHRILVLENLERTSRDAMQAWLKVFEEPPPRAQFILTTKNHHQLPITILSRVTVLSVANNNTTKEVSADIDTFLSTSDLITKFQQIDTLDKAQKDDPTITKRFVEDLMQHSRTQPRYQKWLPKLFKAHQDLNQNVNRRLVLEHLALQLQNK